MPWHYKPSTVWRGPIFYNQGSEIVAEVAAGASRAVLKGQYRLDEGRIKTEIAVLRGFIAAALGSLPGQQAPKSYLQDSLSLPVQRMVADGVRKIRSDDVEKNRQAYANCIRLLDNSIAGLRVLSSQYYLKYHNACLTIEEVVDALVHLGVPLGQIMPPILNMMHGMPVSR